jgi:capsule polysaccharide export protein KpsE/RkpR
MIITTVMDSSWMRHPWRRRLVFGLLAALFALLAIWPRHYIAEAELVPQTSGTGLSSLLSGGATGSNILNLNNILGQGQSIEAGLAASRSHVVATDVISTLHLVGRPGFPTAAKAEVKLRQKVNIEAVRGAIIQIKARDSSPKFALQLAAGFSAAIERRLSSLSLEQTVAKRNVAADRLKDAAVGLARAQGALAAFRDANKLAAPEAQLGAAVSQLANLQAQLRAKQVELGELLRFATPNNLQVEAAQAAIASLKAQISQAQSTSGADFAGTVEGTASKGAQYLNLYRNERFYEVISEIYTRYLEATTIDELSSSDTVSELEPPFVDPKLQYNIWAVGLLFLDALLAFGAEFYVLRPPLGISRTPNANLAGAVKR